MSKLRIKRVQEGREDVKEKINKKLSLFVVSALKRY